MKDIFGLCKKIHSLEQFLSNEFSKQDAPSPNFYESIHDFVEAVREHIIFPQHIQLLDGLIESAKEYVARDAQAREDAFQDIVLKVVMLVDEVLLQPLEYVKGIGPKVAKLMNKLGIHTVKDALYYFPRGYSDRRELPSLELIFKQRPKYATIRLKIENMELIEQRFHRVKNIVKAVLTDGKNRIIARWFNQKYIIDNFKAGDSVVLSGPLKYDLVLPEFDNPLIDAADREEPIHLNRIVPEYPLTQGVKQKLVRRVLYQLVTNVVPIIYDYLPEIIRKRNKLLRLPEALLQLHFPRNDVELEYLNSPDYPPRRRMKFDEFFLFQLAILLKKQEFETQGLPPKFSVPENFIEEFQQLLPFTMTGAQKRAISDILSDVREGKVMNRLLCGDVGSGKTVVALAAVYLAVKSGYQAAMMVPTEILAQQHYSTARQILPKMRIALLTGSITSAEKKAIYEALERGTIDFIIGTHALLQPDIAFSKLGLVITDEQHRFGVRQRAMLKQKGVPHFLVMSATPIPRTLAMTVYGDLDLSIIDELPPNRQKVETYLFRDVAQDRKIVYNIIRDELKKGHQAYVVYPLLQESNKGVFEDVKDATSMAQELQRVFSDFKVALVHGKMKGEEKERVITAFRAGQVHILVSTTVIEVGIDVPTATVIVIEHAERFGLSQLHQLRGRIGRGAAKSYCIVIASKNISALAEERLKIFVELHDGFKIAEKDLELRGPGELSGVRQHGLPEFKIGNIIEDAALLKRARAEAEWLLQRRLTRVLEYYARRFYIDRIQMGDVA